MTTKETPQDRFNAARSKFLNGMVDASFPETSKPTGAHLSAQQEGQQDRFKDARSKFLNGMVDTSSPEIGEPIDAPKREFKHKVKMSGIIHTSTNPNYGLTNEERVGNRGLFRL